MSFGNNLQFLRKMHNRITQEELAEKLGVSRQTISKWEQDLAYPEIEKMIDLCQIFSCTMDQLVREEMNNHNEAFSDIFICEVEPTTYIQYAVISCEPEDDAISHMKQWAEVNQCKEPDLVGWDSLTFHKNRSMSIICMVIRRLFFCLRNILIKHRVLL